MVGTAIAKSWFGSQEGNLLAQAMDQMIGMVLVRIAQTLHQAGQNRVVCNK